MICEADGTEYERWNKRTTDSIIWSFKAISMNQQIKVKISLDCYLHFYTHLEYDYARRIKKPIRIIRLSNDYLKMKRVEGEYTEEDLNNSNLIQFRNNLPLGNNVDSVSEIKSVAKTLLGSLSNLEEKDVCGWVKSLDVAPLIKLHSNNISLARNKSIQGDYYLYYYSVQNKRNVFYRFEKYCIFLYVHELFPYITQMFYSI